MTRRRAAAGAAGAAAIAGGIVGGLFATRDASAPSVVATVPATYYVSATGSDTAACTLVAPCKTIDRAARKATACGDKVKVLAGVYPKQTITQDAAKAAWPNGCHVVVYGGEYDGTGADPKLKGLTVQGDHLELIHLDGDQSGCVTTQIEPAGCVALVLSGAVDVSVGYSTGFARLFVYGGDVQSVAASDFGPSYDNHGIVGSNAKGLSIFAVSIHDQVHSQACVATPGCWGQHHMNCFTFNDVQNVSLRMSKLWACDDTALLVKPYNGLGIDGLVVENTWLGPTGGFGSVSMSVPNPSVRTTRNVDFKYVTFSGPILLDPGIVYTGSELRYSIGPAGNCTAFANGGFAASYNVSTGAACGVNSLSNVPTLALAVDGYHLTGGSPAVDFVPSTEPHPPNDVDFAWVRPTGPALDAGADEFTG